MSKIKSTPTQAQAVKKNPKFSTDKVTKTTKGGNKANFDVVTKKSSPDKVVSKYDRVGVTWSKAVGGKRSIVAISQKHLPKPYLKEEQDFLDKRNKDRRESRDGDRQAHKSLYGILTPEETQDAFCVETTPTAEFPGRVARAARFAIENLRKENAEYKRRLVKEQKKDAALQQVEEVEDNDDEEKEGDNEEEKEASVKESSGGSEDGKESTESTDASEEAAESK